MPQHPLADDFRSQGRACERMDAPLYAALLAAMADDLDAGGPTAAVVRGREDAPRSDAVPLRLLGALHRLVLQRRAPELALHYRSSGGTAGPERAWEAARPLLRRHADELRAALDVAPQTNEPGRAAALAVGLHDVVHRTNVPRVRLLEVGASAGLVLRLDAYRVEGSGPAGPFALGPETSPLVLPDAVRGDVVPAAVEVVERTGCDLSPVDPATQEGRLRLTSFVWPDHPERHERLRAALEVAARVPAPVDRASAADWLAARLSEPADGVLDVVLHSVTRPYWPVEERRAVDDVIAEAARGRTLARVCVEPRGDRFGEPFRLEAQVLGPDGPDGRRTGLGEMAPHGVPTVLDPGVAVRPRGGGDPA